MERKTLQAKLRETSFMEYFCTVKKHVSTSEICCTICIQETLKYGTTLIQPKRHVLEAREFPKSDWIR